MVDEPVASDIPAPDHLMAGAESITPFTPSTPSTPSTPGAPVERRAGGAHRKTKPGKEPKAPKQPKPPRGSKSDPLGPIPDPVGYSAGRAYYDPTAVTTTVTTTETGEGAEAADAVKAAKAGAAAKSVTPSSKKSRPFWVEAVVLLVIAAVIAVGVHSFLFQAFFIPTGSMENTLLPHDRVIVNRLSYRVGHVQRGQIVVFSGVDSWSPEGSVTPPHNPVLRELSKIGGYLGFAPSGEQDFIKRVIGLPGDHVVCCNAQGRITVNGHPLVENYLYPGSDNRTLPFDITVPAGHLWVEGDHRNDSADSRSHTGLPGGGSIPINKVIGRAFVIVWPISRFGGLSTPSSFSTVSSATASALPSSVGLAAVLPIALVRLRLRRKRRQRRNAGPRTT